MNTTWTQLLRYGVRERGRLTLVGVLTMAGIGLDLLKPWPLKFIVDHTLRQEPLPAAMDWLSRWPGGAEVLGQLTWLAVGSVTVFLAAQVCRLVLARVQSGVGARLMYALGADLFRHLLQLSGRFHGRQRVGDLVKRVTTDTGCVKDLFLWVGLLAASSVVSLASMWWVMWRLNPVLSWWALAVAPLLGLVVWWFAAAMSTRTYEQQQREGEILALAEQTLTALPVVQAFGQEQEQERKFGRLSRRVMAANLRATATQMQFGLATRIVMALGTAALLWVGGWQVVNGALTVGGLVVFLSYLASLYAPLETLAYLSTGVASVRAGHRRIQEVWQTDEVIADDADATVPDGADQHGCPVEFVGVTFGYEPDRPVLREVNLRVAAGETVAVVGPTGAGKSTLVSLIPRLVDPWTGQVRVAGQDARRWPLRALRDRVALVLQEPLLLPVSVAENIRLARPAATEDAVREAARAARAEDFILRLPRGYDTVLGERGATLSGGERQRLALARGLLKAAPVVILDEPTSALDAATEAALWAAVKDLLRGRTVFIIAHRATTIQWADRVVALEAGRLVERHR